MYISENSKVCVQGITGNQGKFHAQLMLEYLVDLSLHKFLQTQLHLPQFDLTNTTFHKILSAKR